MKTPTSLLLTMIALFFLATHANGQWPRDNPESQTDWARVGLVSYNGKHYRDSEARLLDGNTVEIRSRDGHERIPWKEAPVAVTSIQIEKLNQKINSLGGDKLL